MLDCFTHTGAFGLNCAKAGAAHVTSVDISADAVELTKANIARNGLADRMEAVQADAVPEDPADVARHAAHVQPSPITALLRQVIGFQNLL